MKIAITGHQRLRDLSMWKWVDSELNNIIKSAVRPVIGVTSLAVGADQHFAYVILKNKGALEVVLPFAGYEKMYASSSDLAQYRQYLKAASKVETLLKLGSEQEAFFAAGKRVVDVSDVLIAVWDGLPAAGLGGTGDVVKYAREHGKKIFHLNPVSRVVARINML